ncbi:MAG TPA: triose-phosphate isomerase [Candidatus Saccharimonadales bacterium]|jgi:triosephosphate isomerase|nr:triose-phosphate isomerase [Candidatus Saccharimonadales bacterium]
MIFVNYKTFEESSGPRALTLTRILEEVAHASQVKIIPVVQIIDAEAVISSTTLEVWIQHVDPLNYGPHTGWTLPEEAAKIGVSGVFLNHSEHKFNDFEALKAANETSMSANLKTLIFAGSLDELKKICQLAPTYVAYEPPELVGSTTTSVARAQPEIISQASEIARAAGEPLIVGAGVSSMEDVKKSLELGAVGVAVATAVVKATDPKAKLLELTEGFK